MATIFLCGHGGYNPADGYATVPKDSTMTFYTPHQKLLKGGDDYKIIQGTFGEPESIVRAFHTCPNLRLYPDDPTVVTYSESVKQGGTTLHWSSKQDGELLSKIFEDNPGADFVWAACRHVSFKNAKYGEKYGVNLVDEGGGNFSKYDYGAQQYNMVITKK